MLDFWFGGRLLSGAFEGTYGDPKDSGDHPMLMIRAENVLFYVLSRNLA